MLEQSVRANLPVIVFVTTGELPYWRESTQHALVVVGLDQSLVYLADPAFVATPQAAQWDEFLLAWSEFDYYCALVRKK